MIIILIILIISIIIIIIIIVGTDANVTFMQRNFDNNYAKRKQLKEE